MKTKPTRKDLEVAIVVLHSALLKIYATENQMSDEGYKTVEDAMKLLRDILK